MRAVEVMGEIDTQHQIQARVPESLPPGPVRVLVLIPEDEDASMAAQAHHDADTLTAAMNAVCAEMDTALDPAWAGMARRTRPGGFRARVSEARADCARRGAQSEPAGDRGLRAVDQ